MAAPQVIRESVRRLGQVSVKRKRIKHHADILAHMACGWQIIGDLQTLDHLKEGVFDIDALTAESSYNGLKHEPLSIATALRNWLLDDAEHNGIPRGMYSEATVRLHFKANRGEGKQLHLERRAESKVIAGESVYTSQFENSDTYLLS